MARTINSDGSVTVDLQFPIKIGGEEVSQITLRRIKGAQFRQMSLARMQDKGDELLKMIQALADIPPSSIDQLDGVDITELSGVVTDFFGLGRRTGEAS